MSGTWKCKAQCAANLKHRLVNVRQLRGSRDRVGETRCLFISVVHMLRAMYIISKLYLLRRASMYCSRSVNRFPFGTTFVADSSLISSFVDVIIHTMRLDRKQRYLCTPPSCNLVHPESLESFAETQCVEKQWC